MSAKGVTPASARIAEIAAWRAERLTQAEIGHRLGVTRQRIQQICEQNGIERGAPEQRWPIPKFATRIKLWLWSAGYRRCPCGTWSEKVTATLRLCPECNRAQAKAYHATEEGKRYLREYEKAHPEVGERARRKYLQKLQSTPEGIERLKQYASEYYKRMMSTEEGRNKFLASSRKRCKKYYEKLTSTEEGRETLNAKQRERRRRKARGGAA